METLKENKPVIAMYDVRGIQEYIFRTNRVKEIIGASEIVEDIIEKTLKTAIEKEMDGKEDNINHLKWSDKKENIEPEDQKEISIDKQKLRFLQPTSDGKLVQAQVLFIGGGNAYVLYRNRELGKRVNERMSKLILEKTYSLQLAVAMIEIDLSKEDYQKDYQNLRTEMDRIKAKMPVARTFGALPIAKTDNATGFPIVKHAVELYPNNPQELSHESYLKQKRAKEMKEEEEKKAEKGIGEVTEKEFDHLVTQHGEESILAIVHIDGNDMGQRIGQILREIGKGYTEAVSTMREISSNIAQSFNENAFEKMRFDLNEWLKKEGYDKKPEAGKSLYFKKDGTYLRKIIVAGDDITFVCNARLALPLVEKFTQYVSRHVLYGDQKEVEHRKKYGFSICAGIAYMHSHFPFHIAYKVAEACCDNAKKRAKEEERKDGVRIGNWVDFQICRNAQMGNLKETREKNYRLSDKSFLLRRPYYIPIDDEVYRELNKINAVYSLTKMIEIINEFKDNEKFARSKVLQLRNTYPKGKNEMDMLISFLKSRGFKFGESSTEISFDEPFAKDEKEEYYATYYDALEMLDFYEEINWKGEK